MTSQRGFLFAAALAVIVSWGAQLGAYLFIAPHAPRWSGPVIGMELELGSSGGALADGCADWGACAENALAIWNPYLTAVQFGVHRNSTAPIRDGDGVNSVFWASSAYGRSLDGILAITLSRYVGTRMTDADVIFNTAYSFNSYRGPWRPGLNEFRRVAVHEFGHVLGLGHPDSGGQNVLSIMNASDYDSEFPQTDDIAGARALYGAAVAPAAPGSPSGLIVSSFGSSVTLAWRAPTVGGVPTTYVVEAGSAPNSSNLANFSTGSTSTVFTASNVGAGVYYVRVRAASGVGVSAASNEAILIVGNGCSAPPTAPTTLVGSATGSTVTLAWSASGGNPTSYIVEGGSGPGLSNLANSDTGSALASLTAPGVAHGVYYVRVRGKNTCGVGPTSNEIVIIVQ